MVSGLSSGSVRYLLSWPLLTLTVFKNVRYVLVAEDVVLGKSPALYWMRGDGPAFWAAWADEEQRADREQV